VLNTLFRFMQFLFLVVFCNTAWRRDAEVSYWGDEPDPAEAADAAFSDRQR
jgi:hypothetical protein